MRILKLPLKGEYFHAIKDGSKKEEYRKFNTYWKKRLWYSGEYTHILLTWGYPRKDDTERQLLVPWKGFRVTYVTHPLFGPLPQQVFAIDVSGEPVK